MCPGSLVTMVAVTRLLWLDSARTLRVVAVVLTARLVDARGGCGSVARWLCFHDHTNLALQNTPTPDRPHLLCLHDYELGPLRILLGHLLHLHGFRELRAEAGGRAVNKQQ